jgi:hypothetical protein
MVFSLVHSWLQGNDMEVTACDLLLYAIEAIGRTLCVASHGCHSLPWSNSYLVQFQGVKVAIDQPNSTRQAYPAITTMSQIDITSLG